MTDDDGADGADDDDDGADDDDADDDVERWKSCDASHVINNDVFGARTPYPRVGSALRLVVDKACR